MARAVGVPPGRLARLKQVHGTDAIVVGGDARFAGDGDDGEWPRADIVMTDQPGMAVAVQVADCVPVLLADPVHGAVAAVHAGWRGAAAGVACRAVEEMRARFRSQPSELVAAIGPSIGPCCYQVGTDVRDAFAAGSSAPQLDDWFLPDPVHGKFRLDVPGAARDQLISAGVRPSNVGICRLCTSCHPALFYSYRREGAGTGRMAAVISPGTARPQP